MSKPLTNTQRALASNVGKCLAALRTGNLFAAGVHFANAVDAHDSMTGVGPVAGRAELAIRSLHAILRDAGLDADVRS